MTHVLFEVKTPNIGKYRVDLMEIDFVDGELLDELLPCFQSANEVRMAVAYITDSGVGEIKNELEKSEDRRQNVKIITGIDFDHTEPNAISKLKEFENVETRHHNALLISVVLKLGEFLVIHAILL